MSDNFKSMIAEQKKGKGITKWNGTLLEYLYKVEKDPDIANFASGRIYNAIMKFGTRPVDDALKTAGYEDLVEYKYFDEKMYGTREAIHDLMKFMKASARRTETGKRILIMVGPVSSGKSTIAALIKRVLENDDTLKFGIAGCPLHEEPLHAIPLSDRDSWSDKLGVKIEGNLCPVCQHNIDNNYTDENGVVDWGSVPVNTMQFSEQKRSGIGTIAPMDNKSQDVSELIGRINLSKMHRHTETDPRGYEFTGELQVANGGVVEFIEILKIDIKLLYVLLTAAQESLIKSPGFPQMYIDTLILGHTNFSEYNSFKTDKKNEALHDRIYPIYVPWNLKLDDEVKIYEKMIRESDFRGIHIAPKALKIAAQFAILSRLSKSNKVSSLTEKMKIYNGEVTKEFKKSEVDLKELIEEGRKNGEGMTGISPRFIINALNIALGMKEDKNCINAIDVIKALRSNFDHQVGYTEEEVTEYNLLLTGEKDSVASEYKEIAKKEVNMAFIYAYDEQAQSLFENYMKNVTSFCKNEKVHDELTGEYHDPDEKLMRSLEEIIEVPSNSCREFRNQIFVYEATMLRQGKAFTFKDYDPLKEAIEKRLMKDLKNVVSLSIADTTNVNPKTKKKRDQAIEKLIEKGYCVHCANNLLQFVSEILRKEN